MAGAHKTGGITSHTMLHDTVQVMASNICTVLETPASTESNRHSTNILVVKGTAHTRLKEIHASYGDSFSQFRRRPFEKIS